MYRRLLALVVALLSTASVALMTAAPASANSATEDGYYCRYVRGMSGAFYYNVLANTRENVPITEVHTASNVFASYKYGSNYSITLGGGLNASGKGWAASASSGATTSTTITRSLPTFAGNSHRKIYAVWNYQRRQVVCTNKDPRSGQIVRRDYTPRQRYVPMSWTSELTTGAASTSVPKCRTGRTTAGVNKLKVIAGEKNAVGINWTKSYTTSASLGYIGVSATVSATNGNSSDFTTWTSSGTSWACGNKSTIGDSSILYVNSL